MGLSINIRDKATPLKVSLNSFGFPNPLLDRPDASRLFQHCEDHLSLDLEKLIRIITAREGGCKLQKGDLDQLREKTASIINQHTSAALTHGP